MKFTTPNTQRIQTELLAEFPDAQFGTYNCRHLSSNRLRPWSQHAASEPKYGYRANALDITHRDHGLSDHPDHVRWLIEVSGWLFAHAERLSIRQVLAPPRRDHKDHVHVDCWPKMFDKWWYTPPCKGGKLKVVYADDSTGDTFGPLGGGGGGGEGDNMFCAYGDSDSENVRYWQRRMNRVGGGLTVDGDYGPATQAAVVALTGGGGSVILDREADAIEAVILDRTGGTTDEVARVDASVAGAAAKDAAAQALAAQGTANQANQEAVRANTRLDEV